MWRPILDLTRCAAGLLLAALACFSCGGPEPETKGGSVHLVISGAEWRYFDAGSDPGAGWHTDKFDDSNWPQGASKLGYGDGDEHTVLRCQPELPPATACPEGSGFQRTVSAYFRHHFSVDDPSEFSRLRLQLLKDDGAVVYLNGVEVVRANMLAGTPKFHTLAAAEVADEDTFHDYRVEPSLLRPGRNLLAVEVHQYSSASWDLAFDLKLAGYDPDRIVITRGPYLQLATQDSATLRWRTGTRAHSVVRYGPSPDQLEQEIRIAQPVTEHSVVLTGLAAGQTVYYALEAAEQHLAGGDTHQFTLPGGKGSQQPLRVWVLGDSGTGDWAAARVKYAFQRFQGDRRLDAWLMLGDNAYDDGRDEEYQTSVFDMYPAQLRSAFLWPAIGNHDIYSTGKAVDAPYYSIFDLPTQGEAGGVASGSEAYYSFDLGPAHFVCLDSAAGDFARDSAMLRWLERDLHANSAPWTVAYFHHPPYSKGWHDSDDPLASSGRMKELRERALPILEQGGVDLVLAGHSHSYERSYLLHGHYGTSDSLDQSMIVDASDGRPKGDGAYNKSAGQPGTVYVVAGSSGRLAIGELDHPAMVESFMRLGSLVLDIEPKRLDVRFIEVDGQVGDHFALIQEVTDLHSE